MRRLKDFYFTIDLRSLGLFRILLGWLLIRDWVGRWPNLEAFYTSFGMLPIEAPLPKAGGIYHFSILDGAVSLPMVQALFGLGLLCYALFLVGYKTKSSHLFSFVFFASVLNRNIVFRAGNDVVLLTMLMWTLFLPMGKRFSIDAIRSGRRSLPAADEKTRSEPSLAAFAVVFQVAVIYLQTAFAKYGSTWTNGTAIYYTMHADQLVGPVGRWLRTQPLSVLKALTWGALGIEYLAAPLILLPVAQPLFRRVAILGLTILQLGIWLTMRIGDFPIVMMSTSALLLGEADWDVIRSLSQRWLRPVIAWRSTQSGQAVAVSPLGHVWRGGLRRLADVAVLLILTAILVDSYNINMASRFKTKRIPEPAWMRAVICVPQLVHDWKLFAPDPVRYDGWWVIDGVTEARESFDPLGNGPTSWEKPRDLSGRYDRFWRKYLARLWRQDYKEHRRYFARYLTRKNHREKPIGHRLVGFRFYYVRETTPPPGTPEPFATQRMLLWTHRCLAESKIPENLKRELKWLYEKRP